MLDRVWSVPASGTRIWVRRISRCLTFRHRYVPNMRAGGRLPGSSRQAAGAGPRGRWHAWHISWGMGRGWPWDDSGREARDVAQTLSLVLVGVRRLQRTRVACWCAALAAQQLVSLVCVPGDSTSARRAADIISVISQGRSGFGHFFQQHLGSGPDGETLGDPDSVTLVTKLDKFNRTFC